MRKGLYQPDYHATEAWERLFGSKQSMVANLQKLIAAMVSLSAMAPSTPEQTTAAAEPISGEEMDLLKAWLAEDAR